MTKARAISHALQAVLVVAAVVATACACKQGGKTGGPVGPEGGDAGVVTGDPAACDKARPAVTALYQKALVQPASEPAAQEVARQAVQDNTEMVMVDCRANPNRFAPCLEAAVSVEQMERDCLIPLDDEGRVEGKTFGGR